MAETGTYMVLTAGTMTFVNEWYQTKQVNWRIPVATVLAGALMEGFAKVAPKGSIALGIMVLIAAASTEFNGKSVASTVAGIFGQATTQPKRHMAPRKAA